MSEAPTAQTPCKAVAGNFASRTATVLCKEIKARLSLRQVGSMLGIDLPAQDTVKFRSPLRSDHDPSCSIKNERLKDWSTGESFDAIDLYAARKGITNREARFELAEHLGLMSGDSSPSGPKGSSFCSLATLAAREPSEKDFQAILTTRKLPQEAEAGLLLAYALGVLRFAEVGGYLCWILTDASGKCAEARRLDRRMFPPLGILDERKAHTLKGSTKRWPVGLAPEVSESRSERLKGSPLVLVEGGPDLLAAYCLLAAIPMSEGDVQPVAMLGAETRIGDEALSVISGRRVIVIAQGNNAGKEASRVWSGQLAAVGCRVQLRDLPDGQDLNDFVTAHGLLAAREVLL